jgi:hypothetical protein
MTGATKCVKPLLDPTTSTLLSSVSPKCSVRAWVWLGLAHASSAVAIRRIVGMIVKIEQH